MEQAMSQGIIQAYIYMYMYIIVSNELLVLSFYWGMSIMIPTLEIWGYYLF